MNRQQKLRSLECEAGYVPPDHIGSARVLRSLEIGGVVFKRGTMLTREQLLAMKPENCRAMILNDFVELHLGPVD